MGTSEEESHPGRKDEMQGTKCGADMASNFLVDDDQAVAPILDHKFFLLGRQACAWWLYTSAPDKPGWSFT